MNRRILPHPTGRLLRALLPVILVALPAGLGAQGDATSGAIDEVTVFEDRARVVRTVPVGLSEGVNRVSVADLPLSVTQSSVLAEVAGVPARVLGVRLDRTVHEADIRAEVTAAEEELRALVTEETELGRAKEVESKRRDLAARFAEYLRQGLLERSTRIGSDETARLLEAESWVSERTIAAEDAIAAVDERLVEIRRRAQEIGENLARLRAGARRITLTAVVQVEASADGAGTLRLGYDVPSARWRPVHEARLDETDGTVAWSYGAEIVQSSGEDWDGASLVLSTQRSSLGLVPPTLVPVRVSGYSIDNRSAGVESAAPSSKLDSKSVSTGDDAEDDGDLSRATIEESGGAASFRIPVRARIPADGRPHRVPIIEAALPVELAFECVPKLSPHTYRRGKLTNSTDAPFLPGTVRVFREGSYVGETTIDSVPPGGSFRLSFGVEGRLVVRRTEITDRDRSVGSFRKGQRRTIGWEFTVRSAMPAPTALSLLDQVPVSEIEGVEVRLTGRCAPEPKVDDDGICRWSLSLVPGGERTVLFEYDVTVPKGVDLPLGAIE